MARKATSTKPERDPAAEECAHWKYQIELAEDDADKWVKRGEKILKRYRDDRPDGGDDVARDRGRFNILWSNVQTLKPSLYGREPVPIAERRFLDKDVVGRAASQILERSMRYEMMDCGFHETVQRCVYDYLLPGRGVAWLRFTPAFGPASSIADRGDDQLEEQDGEPVTTSDDGRTAASDEQSEGEDRSGQSPQEKLIGASLNVDYVNWKDFLHSRARIWDEVEWIAKRIYMSRQDLVDNFGKKVGNKVPLEQTKDSRRDREAQTNTLRQGMQKAVVYEIWCKYDRKVYFVAKGYNQFLEEPREDPLNLEGFWPVPRPLFSTMTNDTLLPVPDYAEYQDQAYELDRLTQRLDLIVSAIQVRGVYDAANKELGRLLDETNENRMIPVASWAAFAQKGGLPAAVSFLPTKELAETATALSEAREQVKKDLYEITGLADVIRGQSDPRETAQAVATKGRFGSLRLQDRQAEVARFCRDIIRMMGEIISEHYPDETLINVSGIMYDEGIGPTMPTAPKKPDEQPAQPPPMMGHNGGPPMPPAPTGMQGPPAGAPPVGLGAGGPPSIPPPQGPPMAPGAPPSPIPPSQGMQPPSVGASSPPQPAMPAMGAAPPAIPPEMQYEIAMAAYLQKKAGVEAEKKELVGKAIELLREDKLRGFRIDIETDSTILDDANEEKGRRTEFVKAVSVYIKEAMTAVQVYPQMLPLVGKLMLFAVRGFRVGRDLESSIEEFIDKAEKDLKAQEGKPKPPDPKVQAEQIKLQAEIQKAQIDAQSSAEDNQRAMAQKQADAQLQQEKQAMEREKMIAELQADRERIAMEQEKMRQELEFKRQEMAMKMKELEMTQHAKATEHAQKLELGQSSHVQALQAGEIAHKRQLEVGSVSHQQQLEAGEVAHKQKLESFKAAPKLNGASA